jgi:hypothetical protein
LQSYLKRFSHLLAYLPLCFSSLYFLLFLRIKAFLSAIVWILNILQRPMC